MDISDVAAIVTGGASGLGAATAARLAQRGAKVALLDLNRNLGAAHADSIGGLFLAADVTDERAVAAALDRAVAAHGIARILVNCAGMGPPAKVVASDGTPMPLDRFAHIISVNLLGTFNLTAKFAARLAGADPIGEERGVIVNTASAAAFDGQVGQAAYAASKGGIVAMTLPIARELARHGIRVMAIAPGLFHTPILDSLSEAARASLASQPPFPARLGRPDEFAQLVESIVTNPMLNGEVIRLDAAIRMAPR
nr:SDR family NAD(P)-dependent oxidoreductase [Sphingomonas sp. Y57]